MTPSPIIIDNTAPTVDFLHWIETQGYRIQLDTDRLWTVASLIGVNQVAYCRGEDFLVVLKGYGKTNEEALDKLRENCSGAVYHPDARKRLGLFLTVGRVCRFPVFSQLSPSFA